MSNNKVITPGTGTFAFATQPSQWRSDEKDIEKQRAAFRTGGARPSCRPPAACARAGTAAPRRTQPRRGRRARRAPTGLAAHADRAGVHEPLRSGAASAASQSGVAQSETLSPASASPCRAGRRCFAAPASLRRCLAVSCASGAKRPVAAVSAPAAVRGAIGALERCQPSKRTRKTREDEDSDPPARSRERQSGASQHRFRPRSAEHRFFDLRALAPVIRRSCTLGRRRTDTNRSRRTFRLPGRPSISLPSSRQERKEIWTGDEERLLHQISSICACATWSSRTRKA